MRWYLAVLIMFLVGAGLGIVSGRLKAFEDITSEKCWLNKQTRDIECISYIP